MTKFINVKTWDVNGEIDRMSFPVDDDKVQDTVGTMLNQLITVIDAWGYGEYEAMYERVASLADNLPINDGFAGIFYEIHINITKKPRYGGCEYGSWLSFILQGIKYDPNTDPFDMREVLPLMGPDIFDFEPYCK